MGPQPAPLTSPQVHVVSFSLYSRFLTRLCPQKAKTCRAISFKNLTDWLNHWHKFTASFLWSKHIFHHLPVSLMHECLCGTVRSTGFYGFPGTKVHYHRKHVRSQTEAVKCREQVRSSTCNVHKRNEFITYALRQINPFALLHFYLQYLVLMSTHTRFTFETTSWVQ